MKNDNNPIHDFWFDKKADDIYIVCSRVANPPKDAYKYSNDYAYSDNFGDKDALFLCYGILSRNYPRSKIQFYYAEDFVEKVRDWQKRNILIIGGPNSRNPVSQFFMYDTLPTIYSKIQSCNKRYLYPPKLKKMQKAFENADYRRERICRGCENVEECPRLALCIREGIDSTLIQPNLWEEVIAFNNEFASDEFNNIRKVRDIPQRGQVVISGCVKDDIGLFATFRNPYDENQKNRIVMISGFFTFGVHGTCQSMSAMNKWSIDNYNNLYYEFIGAKAKDFICYNDIHITQQRETRFLKLDMSRVIPLIEGKECKNINNIFISYRRTGGRQSALQVFDLLKTHNEKKIYPFIDYRRDNINFIPGMDYVIDIQQKIVECDVFVSIISKDCFSSDTGNDGGYKSEWFWAIMTKQMIIPIECEGAKYADELNKIKDEIINHFGEKTFRELTRITAVSILQDNIVATIERQIKGHYQL